MWINLPFPKFYDFLIKNAEEFKKDREEYDAAVEKYDRLKSKHGEGDMVFPYRFGIDSDPPKKELSTKSSVIITDIDMLQDYRRKYPKMCKRVEESTGIPQDCEHPKSVEMFLDQFEHLTTTYEAKNGKKYTE